MSYDTYLKAEYRLNQELIRRARSETQEGKPPNDVRAKMREMKAFLHALGNPQQSIPAVHITGTSGKGSVAAGVAGILTEAGLKVGLHVSPYLQSATEKIWVADQFASAEAFHDLVEWVMPVAGPRVNPHTPASIHGMASVAIALEGFRRERVDVMVFEAGAGGRFDLSNRLDTEVAVVTNVGYDHVISLGPTLEDIAWHKAGIAKAGKPLITGATGGPLDVIRREAEARGAIVTEVAPKGDGAWSHNRALAKAAAEKAAAALGRHLSPNTIEQGFRRVRLAGRSEVMPGAGPRVVLDGAHNPEKLTVAVNASLAHAGDGPKVCLFGLLSAKAKIDTVEPLRHRFDHVVVTEPTVYAKKACPAEETAELLSAVGYQPTIERDEARALDTAMDLATADGDVVVTGSFYLIGNIREHWYPKEAVVTERTSFPRLSEPTAKSIPGRPRSR